MTFYETITAAINDIIEHGYDSQERVDDWVARIREAAEKQLMPEAQMQRHLSEMLTSIYQQLVDKGGAARYHEGLSLFTLRNLKPHLRPELDRRIMASANLIKLNREESISNTLRRFRGWATSVPIGGSDVQSRSKTKDSVKKSMKSLPFEERRVLIDQGHKLTSSINDIIAKDEGAIAAKWHSHWRQLNYHYRKDHKERDEHVYLVRGSWAHEQGLVKPGPAGYFDEITQPGEEVFCRCYVTYIYSLRKLPADMMTKKGGEKLAEARQKVKEMMK